MRIFHDVRTSRPIKALRMKRLERDASASIWRKLTFIAVIDGRNAGEISCGFSREFEKCADP